MAEAKDPTAPVRRRHATLILGAAGFAMAGIARAQAPWPNRPVRVIVGFPPGGSLDVMTRLAAEQMAQRLGQPFVVETRGGPRATSAPRRSPAPRRTATPSARSACTTC